MKPLRDEANEQLDRLDNFMNRPGVQGVLFVASIYDPIDYVVTAIDVVDNLRRGERWGAVGNIAMAAVPVLPGNTDNILRMGLLGSIPVIGPVIKKVDDWVVKPIREHVLSPAARNIRRLPGIRRLDRVFFQTDDFQRTDRPLGPTVSSRNQVVDTTINVGQGNTTNLQINTGHGYERAHKSGPPPNTTPISRQRIEIAIANDVEGYLLSGGMLGSLGGGNSPTNRIVRVWSWQEGRFFTFGYSVGQIPNGGGNLAVPTYWYIP